MLPVVWSTLRIAWSPSSAIRTLPDPSTATPVGLVRVALVAAPPSPHGVAEQGVLTVPAIVLMLPVVWSTLRIAWSPSSPIRTLPDPSTATPVGPARVALVAAPPSPHGAAEQ